jgi:hypothetical protein
MKIVQIELEHNGERQVYWVKHDPYEDAPLRKGMHVTLEECPDITWTLSGKFLTLREGAALPPKARQGTISFLV